MAISLLGEARQSSYRVFRQGGWGVSAVSWRLEEHDLQDETAGFQDGKRIAQASVWTLLAPLNSRDNLRSIHGKHRTFRYGIDSLSDAVVSFSVSTGLHFAGRRPSKKFPYGYYKVESVAALLAEVVLRSRSFVFRRSYKKSIPGLRSLTMKSIPLS